MLHYLSVAEEYSVTGTEGSQLFGNSEFLRAVSI